MTLQSRRILNRLIKCVPSVESPIEIPPKGHFFNIDMDPIIKCNFAPYENEIMSIIPYLESLGYVRISENNETIFYMTHAGLHFREIKFNNFIITFIKSVIVPIGVSAATTLLTLWLKGLLPLQ